ncbi:MAG TPA: hypothetical protein VI434_03230 [Candidatus Dormibacteraeota bacterium]
MSSPQRAGFAIETHRSRRLLVIATLIGTALLVSSFPASLFGFGLIAVLALTTLDLLLIRSTCGLAFARGATLDERERALRDRAYRVGFGWLGLGVVLLYIVLAVTAVASSVVNNASQTGPVFGELDAGITGRVLFALLELLCIVPTMVIAWNQRDDLAQPRATRARGMRLMWLALPALIVLWILEVSVAPVQAAPRDTADTPGGGGPPGTRCTQFVKGSVFGGPFGATVGIRVEVCWNGVDAFVVGDPNDSLPASALAAYGPPGSISEQDANPPEPDETDCGGDTNADFASVTETCTANIDAAGTLHYVVRAQVSPLPFSIGARVVTMAVVVTRNGMVITQP